MKALICFIEVQFICQKFSKDLRHLGTYIIAKFIFDRNVTFCFIIKLQNKINQMANFVFIKNMHVKLWKSEVNSA